jgi:hypothetical protein
MARGNFTLNSDSLDRFEQVERSKIVRKLHKIQVSLIVKYGGKDFSRRASRASRAIKKSGRESLFLLGLL